jgi:hypothetical protein
MEEEKFYYHITDVKNVESILKFGLRANEDGDIFLFENKSIGYPSVIKENGIFYQCDLIDYISDHIARGQLFLKRYAMFEVSAEGIVGEFINDNVAEYGSQFQWIAKQQIITPNHITLYGYYDTEKPRVRNKQMIEIVNNNN